MTNNKKAIDQEKLTEAKIKSVWKSLLFFLIFCVLLLSAFAPNWNISNAFFMASVVHFCLVSFWLIFNLGFMSKSFQNWKSMLKNHPFKKKKENDILEKKEEKDIEVKSWLGLSISLSLGAVLLIVSIIVDLL